MYFYARVIDSWKQAAVFLLSIAVSYAAGLLLQRLNNSNNTKSAAHAGVRRAVLFVGIILSALPLLLVKAGDFLSGSVVHKPGVSWIVPVGLSFYTLQLAAYLVDIYRGETDAQLNPLKYGLFATFFPQVIQGPIPRYKQLHKELFEGNDYNPDNIMRGIQLVIWGFFLKFMIADKAAVIVNAVFDNYHAYSGVYVWVAAIVGGEVVEEESSPEQIEVIGSFRNRHSVYNLRSNSMSSVAYSCLYIEGVQYTRSVTGLNIAVYDLNTCKVIDRVTFQGASLLR